MIDRDDEKQPPIELFDGSVDELDDAAQQPPATPAPENREPPLADIDLDDAVGEQQEQEPTASDDLANLDEPIEDAADATDADVGEEEAAEDVEDEEPDSDDEPTEELTEAEATELEQLAQEIAAFRAENDIPDDPAGYAIPEEAAALAGSSLLSEFMQEFHNANLPQETVSTLLNKYAAETAKVSQRDDADAQALKAQMDAGDIKLITRLLEDSHAVPPAAREAILTGRRPDGTRLANDPAVLDFLRDSAKARYGDGQQQRRDRIKEIEAVRDRSTSEYFERGMSDELLKLMAAENANAPAEPRSADAARLAHIEQVMNTDMNDYYRQGLDVEYAELLARGAGQQQRRSGRAR
jgi:hypothetical protein